MSIKIDLIDRATLASVVLYDVCQIPGVDGAPEGYLKRCARSLMTTSPRQDLKRTRVPGTDGSLIIRCGFIGRMIDMEVRYIGDSILNIKQAYDSDMIKLANQAVDISYSEVLDGVSTEMLSYKACNIVPGSVKETSIVPTGRIANQVFFNVNLKFTEDQPEIVP